jgi:hypothetical protein
MQQWFAIAIVLATWKYERVFVHAHLSTLWQGAKRLLLATGERELRTRALCQRVPGNAALGPS